jgi:hypothetical protein
VGGDLLDSVILIQRFVYERAKSKNISMQHNQTVLYDGNV